MKIAHVKWNGVSEHLDFSCSESNDYFKRKQTNMCADKHVLSGDNTHLQWLSITFIMAAVYFPSQTPRLLHFWASHAYIASYLCTAHTHSITRSVHNSVRLINCGSRQCRKGKLKQTGTMRNQHRT